MYGVIMDITDGRGIQTFDEIAVTVLSEDNDVIKT